MPATFREGGVELRNLSGGRIRDVSAHVRRGEIVGFTGTVDSGLSSLAPLIGGAIRGDGEVAVDGKTLDVGSSSPSAALRAGIAYIPQDRHGEGLATELTVEENVTIPHLKMKGRPWWSGGRWQRTETNSVLAGFDVRPHNPRAVVATLSGGNQQKVLMGKWLLGGPGLLVLDDPTQAVDVGARGSVLRATRQAAVDGAAVVLCSSEPDDLVSVCDRVLVLNEGEVAVELVRPFTAEDILAAVFGATDGGLE
jgi:ribose transport system ATP-binding protein